MINRFCKSLWLIAGIIFIFAGIVATISPESTLTSIAYILGAALLIAGIGNMLIFAFLRHSLAGTKWFLAEGIVTFLLALFLLFSRLETATAIPYIFCMWIIFSGITKFIAAFEMKSAETPGWVWLVLIGVLAVAVGFFTLFSSTLTSLAINLSLGLFLILQGVFSLAQWFLSRRML